MKAATSKHLVLEKIIVFDNVLVLFLTDLIDTVTSTVFYSSRTLNLLSQNLLIYH